MFKSSESQILGGSHRFGGQGLGAGCLRDLIQPPFSSPFQRLLLTLSYPCVSLPQSLEGIVSCPYSPLKERPVFLMTPLPPSFHPRFCDGFTEALLGELTRRVAITGLGLSMAQPNSSALCPAKPSFQVGKAHECESGPFLKPRSLLLPGSLTPARALGGP